MRAMFCTVGVALSLAMPLAARQAAPKTAAEMKAASDAHHADFDYLLGDWEFTSTSREFGTGHGVWSAVRLSEGQILDEFRILDTAGKTVYVTTTVRAYNARLGLWELVGMDEGSGLQNVGSGMRVGTEVHLEQKGEDDTGKAMIMRIRYYDVLGDRFSWRADQSSDGGKTWTKDVLRIEARRIGPPRAMNALTPRK